MRIPEKVETILKEADLAWVGTCSSGVPNVNIVYYFKVIDDDKILLADNYFNKTRENIEKNPRIALTIKSSEESVAYEVKGSAEIHTEGEIFDEMVKWVHSEDEEMPTKSAVVLKVEKIFDSTPGETAGEEITEI